MAFYQCKNAHELLIPKSVTSIGAGAFEECNVNKVTVLGDVKVGKLPFGSWNPCLETLEIAGKFEGIALVSASEETSLPNVVLRSWSFLQM